MAAVDCLTDSLRTKIAEATHLARRSRRWAPRRAVCRLSCSAEGCCASPRDGPAADPSPDLPQPGWAGNGTRSFETVRGGDVRKSPERRGRGGAARLVPY